MKVIAAVLIIISAVGLVFAVDDAQILEFKSKIGFVNGEDKINAHQFFDDERKILIFGDKNLQVWDTNSGKLLVSAAHRIPQFAPRGFVSDFLLLRLPRALDWRPFIFDISGKWLITVEKVGTKDARSAIVRDLRDLKQIAVLNLPNAPIDWVAFDESKNEILAQGDIGNTNEFAGWNAADFSLKSAVSIDQYKWHQLIYNESKMLVGSGDTKILWKGLNIKQGDYLTLRDVKTGAVEREYTAQNLKPKTAFQETTISEDEKYLISKRDDRIFVWEIAGDGSPKYEISNPNLKGVFNLKEIVSKKYIVVRVDDQLRVYDIAGDGTPKIVVSNPNPKENVSFKDVYYDKYLIAKFDERFRIYDIEADGKPFFELAPSNPKENFYFSNIVLNRMIVVQAGKKLRVYDAATDALKFEFASDDANDSIEYCDATADGKYIVASDDRKIYVFDLENGKQPLYEIRRDSEKERFRTIRFLNERKWLYFNRINNAEKKEPRTEFYDIQTGKLIFTAPFQAGTDLKFSPDGNLMYQTVIGEFDVWNFAESKSYSLKLKYYSPPAHDYNEPNYYSYTSELPYNTEFAAFDPDYRYVLRYNGNVTSIYEAETGKRLQNIFDAERVKYDKKTGQIKSSGLDDAGWLKQGRFVFALDSGGVFSDSGTVSFWEVKK